MLPLSLHIVQPYASRPNTSRPVQLLMTMPEVIGTSFIASAVGAITAQAAMANAQIKKHFRIELLL
jgi:hypothetical protein